MRQAQRYWDDDTATQAQIDAAWNDLLNVIHYLDFQAGDASALEELYNILSGLVEDDFTSDSWAAFEEAMAQAAEVIGRRRAAGSGRHEGL